MERHFIFGTSHKNLNYFLDNGSLLEFGSPKVKVCCIPRIRIFFLLICSKLLLKAWEDHNIAHNYNKNNEQNN